MKFLIVLSVFAFYCEASPFFGGNFGGGHGSVSVESGVSGGSGNGHKDLIGGFGSILAIPLQIKSKIIQAKRAKLNKIFDGIEGVLGKLSNHGGHSGSVNVGVSAGSSIAQSGSVSVSGQNNVNEVYHPEPAPQVNYSQQPVVVHLYQGQAQAPVQEIQQHSQAQAISVVQPEPQIYEQAPISAPVQPQNTYGPPDYQPAQPIHHVEAAAQTSEVRPVENSYLPPHGGNCQDASHFH